MFQVIAFACNNNRQVKSETKTDKKRVGGSIFPQHLLSEMYTNTAARRKQSNNKNRINEEEK